MPTLFADGDVDDIKMAIHPDDARVATLMRVLC